MCIVLHVHVRVRVLASSPLLTSPHLSSPARTSPQLASPHLTIQGNSGDYYETEACLHRMFALDWSVAQGGHGLDRAIIRQDGAGSAWADEDGDVSPQGDSNLAHTRRGSCVVVACQQPCGGDNVAIAARATPCCTAAPCSVLLRHNASL